MSTPRTTILAASAAALILPQGALTKPLIDNEGHAYLTITLMGPHATGKNERLEVESWHWGTTRSAGNNQLKLDDSAGASRSTTGRVTGIASHPPDAAGGRGVDIARVDGQIAPGPGMLTVRGRLPGCRVGVRYPRAMMSDGNVRFTIDGLVVASCGSGGTSAAPREEVTFSYSKVAY